MAITVITEPTDLMPIHSPIMYLLSSTLSAEKNFKIVFEIGIFKDFGAGLVDVGTRKVKISPRPDGMIEFDMSTHLRDYLDDINFQFASGGDSTFSAPFVQYRTQLSEEYINSVTNEVVIPSNDGTGNLSDYIATNIVLNRSEYLNYSPIFWRNGSSTLSNVLLNSKPNSSYYKDDVIWVHSVDIGSGYEFELLEYTLASTISHTLPVNFESSCVFYKLDLSTFSFNANTKSVGIRFLDGDGNITKELIFKLKDIECSSFDKYRFIYLDKLGSYNTISLNHASNESLSITRENFRNRLDPLTDLDSSRGLQTYFTDAKETYTLNTGNLNADDMAKFEDLLLSTRVMLDVRSHPDSKFDGMEYVPFMINTKSMKRYKSENQQIAQYTIEGELGYKLNVRTK